MITPANCAWLTQEEIDLCNSNVKEIYSKLPDDAIDYDTLDWIEKKEVEKLGGLYFSSILEGE